MPSWRGFGPTPSVDDAEEAMRALQDMAAALGNPDEVSEYPDEPPVIPEQQRSTRRAKQELVPSAPEMQAPRKPETQAQRKSERKKAGTKRPRKADEDTYHCRVCDKTFDKSARLYRHMETHKTKEDRKKYVCTVPNCGKKYLRLDHLKRHQITHKGVKPFVCPGGKAFFYHYHLLRHERSGCCKGKRRRLAPVSQTMEQQDKQLQEQPQPGEGFTLPQQSDVARVGIAAPAADTPDSRPSLDYTEVAEDCEVGDFLDAPLKDGVQFLYESLLESHRISHH